MKSRTTPISDHWAALTGTINSLVLASSKHVDRLQTRTVVLRERPFNPIKDLDKEEAIPSTQIPQADSEGHSREKSLKNRFCCCSGHCPPSLLCSLSSF